VITPLEFYAWLIVVPLVLVPAAFFVGVLWRRSDALVDQLTDMDTRVHGDDAVDAFLAEVRDNPAPRHLTAVVIPERPVIAPAGQLAEAELRARTLHPTYHEAASFPPYTELDAWRAEERGLPTGAESTTSRLLHLIIGGMTMRDALPGRAADALAAVRRALEADRESP
jgi:hypothetical protein